MRTTLQLDDDVLAAARVLARRVRARSGMSSATWRDRRLLRSWLIDRKVSCQAVQGYRNCL